MKRGKLTWILVAVLTLPIFARAGEIQEKSTGFVCVEQAVVYADAMMTQAISQVELGEEVAYDSGIGESVSAVRCGDVQGYMPRTYIGIPPEGEWQGYDTGAVLCQTLSLRTLPVSTSERLGVLEAGERFVILANQDGFYLAAQRMDDESGSYYQTGWVDADYVAKNRGTLTTTGTVHARAYGDEAAPLVGEIACGTVLNCIARLDDYYVISLRGASAFVHVDEPVALDGMAKTEMEAE